MRMEDLRYLIRVAEIGSISQAAEACYITQQGLSRIIISLEKELGVRLFHRGGNRILLTDVGEVVVARAKELDAMYQHMLNDISQGSNDHEGTPPVDCHIYTSQLICATFLPKVLSALNLRYPGININVEELATIPLALCNTEAMMARNLLDPGMEPAVALHISSYNLCRDVVFRGKAAGLTSALRDHYSQCPVKAIPIEKKITVSYGCIYDPAVPRTPFIENLFSIVKAELSHI